METRVDDMLFKQLRFEEGFREDAYRCTKGKLTIGYGHNLDANPYYENHKKIPHHIDRETAEKLLEIDVERITEQLYSAWHWFQNLDRVRKDAVINMAFQMGTNGFMGFGRMRDALVHGNWKEAYKQALDSEWYKRDTPARAKRVAGQFLTGVHYDPDNLD